MPDELLPSDLSPDQLRQDAAQRAQDIAQQRQLQQNADRATKSIFRRIQNRTIKPGSLVAFQYTFYKHDFTPLCLVGRIHANNMISGLNLHYLTLNYIKYLVNTFCGKNFSYQAIKGNKYIVNAYRSYKKEGRRQVRLIDCDFLNNTLKVARSFKPGEVEAIRKEVQKQLQQQMHPRAEDIAKEYQEIIKPNA